MAKNKSTKLFKVKMFTMAKTLTISLALVEANILTKVKIEIVNHSALL